MAIQSQEKHLDSCLGHKIRETEDIQHSYDVMSMNKLKLKNKAE